MTQIWNIAHNTYRELIRDRILYGLIFFAIILLGFSLAMGQLSFSEQTRISANFGFSAIHLGAVILSIFIGSSLVAKEIDKQTILTLLIKPLTRTQFLLGKSLGLLMVNLTIVFGLAIIEIIIFLGLGANISLSFFTALYGIFLESVLLLGITLFFSTFTRPLLVVSFSLSIFLIGHWLNNLYMLAEKSDSSAFKAFAIVVTSALPNLERFNWRDLVVYPEPIVLSEIASATFYCFSWAIFLFVVTKVIFERKDFA